MPLYAGRMTSTPQPVPSAVGSATVDAVLRRSAARYPDRTALTFDDRRWTYAALDSAVDRVAAMLLGLGLDAGTRVAAYGVNSDAYLIAFLAITATAVASLVAQPAFPTNEKSSRWYAPGRR